MLKNEISAAFLPQFMAGYQAQGFNADALLEACGLAPDLLRNPQATLSFEQFSVLHKKVALRMQDETMGLLGTPQSLGTFELLARVLLQCGTIAEAGAELADLSNRRPHGLTHSFTPKRSGVEFAVEIQPGSTVLNDYAIDSVLLHSYRHLCWLCVERVPIVRVELPFAPPPWHEQYARMYPGANILFERKHASLLLDKACLTYPVIQNKSELNAFLSSAFGMLPRMEERLGPRSRQIKILIESHLAEHQVLPEFVAVANAMGEADYTLRRRLATEGVTYKDLIALTRKSMATKLLLDKEQKVETVAFTLGYIDSSSFVRAFKLWMGITPAAYRDKD